MKTLHPPQEAHVQRLLKVLAARNSAADLSPCGLGKTVCAAEVARIIKRPLFVVAPLSTLPAWREELAERGVPAVVTNYEKLRSPKYGWTTKDRANRWSWNLDPKTLIVFDEAQRLKTPNSIISKIGVSAKPYTTLLLSGSLAESPIHLRAPGYLLGLHDLRTYLLWAQRRGCKINIWGKLEFNDDEKILDQLHHEIMPNHGSRMSYAEMRQFLPDNRIIFDAVDFGDAGQIKKLYAEMEVELLILEEIASEDKKGAEALTAQLRARQKAELLKVPLLAERAQALAAEGASVLVFLNYNASLEALSTRLGGIPLISGQHGNREQVIQDFRADRTPILALNVAAGGVGINLHGKRPRRTLLTPDFNPVAVLQALGRAPRVGGSDVVQWVLHARGTIEEPVVADLKQKLRNIDIINEGLAQQESVDLPNQITDTASSMTDPKTPENDPEISTNPEPEHAQYNPSSLTLFERCPGYLNRTGETNEQAERGTRIHKALETDDLDGLEEEKERPIAQLCSDFIEGLLADELPAKPDVDLREIKLQVDLKGGITTFGTCDRAFRFGRRAVVVDYKSGYLAVTDAETNPQAWAYVIGIFQKKTLGFDQVDTVDFYFLIPNRDEISHHQFKREDVPMMQLRLNTIIRKAMDADPKYFSPQVELCEYCARAATCPALANKIAGLGKKMKLGIDVPDDPRVSIDRIDDIPKILHLTSILETWAKEARAEALRLNLEEGVEIKGFKRVERSTPRAVTSVLGAYDAVKDDIELEDFLMCASKVSLPKLEDLVRSRATGKKGCKKAAAQDLENKLRAHDVLRDEGSIFYLRPIKK